MLITRTADDQPNASNDRLTTAKVRKAIMADRSPSKGPVKSEEEKQRIAADRADVIPAGNVTNQLTVKP